MEPETVALSALFYGIYLWTRYPFILPYFPCHFVQFCLQITFGAIFLKRVILPIYVSKEVMYQETPKKLRNHDLVLICLTRNDITMVGNRIKIFSTANPFGTLNPNKTTWKENSLLLLLLPLYITFYFCLSFNIDFGCMR